MIINDPLSTELEVPRSHAPDPSEMGGFSDLDSGRLIVPFFTVFMHTSCMYRNHDK